MNTTDAYEIHTQLIERRNKNKTIERVIHHNQYRKIFGEKEQQENDAYEESHWFDQLSFALDKEMLDSADTIFVSENVQELIETAKATMPDEVLFESDVYTPAGFVVLEKPFDYWVEDDSVEEETVQEIIKTSRRLRDSHGCSITGERKFQKNASGCYTERNHSNVVALAFGNFETFARPAIDNFSKTFAKFDEEKTKEFISFSQQSMPASLQVRVYGHFVETEIDGLSAYSSSLSKNLHLVDCLEIGYGEDGQIDYDHETEDENIKNYSNNRRFIITLLRLLDDYIDADSSTAPRAYSRRGIRAGRSKTNITRLSLRKSVYGETDNSNGDKKIVLAHLVRGHWRKQWYPSQQQHRAKWINAHRRGGNQTDVITQKHRLIAVTK